VVFVDEVIFTAWTNQNFAFARKYKHCKRPKVEPLPFKQWHVVAAVSMEYGLEAYQLHKYSVTSKRFLRILPSLKRIGPDFVLFGDSASWHRSKLVKKRLERENLNFIYNIKCQPDLNAIEKVFLMIKTKFKRLKLKQTLADEDI
jgi:hypothetical protein